MNRRKMLGLLGLAPPLLLSSCEHNFPITPTIVTGKVVDENNNPVEGINLFLNGSRRTGFSGIGTFNLSSGTDKAGVYEFSQIVPDNTDDVFIMIDEETLKGPDGYVAYWVYSEIDGNYNDIAGSHHRFPSSNYGKTIIFNYQLRKK